MAREEAPDRGSEPQMALKMLDRGEYAAHPTLDPIKFYRLPVLGRLYRRRVELCLSACKGGERVLEVGFGSGVSFLSLSELYAEIHGVDLTAPIEDVQAVFRKRNLTLHLTRGNVLELPHPDGFFDTVLLTSILEHLKPGELDTAFAEIARVLKPHGQVVYGVPVERPLMVFAFKLLGYNIREHHFSTEREVGSAARRRFGDGEVLVLHCPFGPIYEVGSFVKRPAAASSSNAR
jgi:SAM-dependent methyltransferase